MATTQSIQSLANFVEKAGAVGQEVAYTAVEAAIEMGEYGKARQLIDGIKKGQSLGAMIPGFSEVVQINKSRLMWLEMKLFWSQYKWYVLGVVALGAGGVVVAKKRSR